VTRYDTIDGVHPRAYADRWKDRNPIFGTWAIDTQEERQALSDAIDVEIDAIRKHKNRNFPQVSESETDIPDLLYLQRWILRYGTDAEAPDEVEDDEDNEPDGEERDYDDGSGSPPDSSDPDDVECPHYKAPGYDACVNCDPDGELALEVPPAPGELDRLRALIVLSPTVQQTLATYTDRGEYTGTIEAAWECMTRAAFTEDGRLLVRFTFGEIEALLDAAHASMTTSKLGSLWCATITARPAITDLSMIAIALPWPKPLHCPAIDDGLWSTVVGHESLETAILMALANLKTFQDANPGIFERAKVTL
jgi:hypothetical protein